MVAGCECSLPAVKLMSKYLAVTFIVWLNHSNSKPPDKNNVVSNIEIKNVPDVSVCYLLLLHAYFAVLMYQITVGKVGWPKKKCHVLSGALLSFLVT